MSFNKVSVWEGFCKGFGVCVAWEMTAPHDPTLTYTTETDTLPSHSFDHL